MNIIYNIEIGNEIKSFVRRGISSHWKSNATSAVLEQVKNNNRYNIHSFYVSICDTSDTLNISLGYLILWVAVVFSQLTFSLLKMDVNSFIHAVCFTFLYIFFSLIEEGFPLNETRTFLAIWFCTSLLYIRFSLRNLLDKAL